MVVLGARAFIQNTWYSLPCPHHDLENKSDKNKFESVTNYDGVRCDHVKLAAWKSQIAAKMKEDMAKSLSQSLFLV